MKPELPGLNIGGTTCSASIGTMHGEIIVRTSCPSEAERGLDTPGLDLALVRYRELADAGGENDGTYARYKLHA